MQITLFNNNKGLVHGNDPARIECTRSGVLKIGSTEIPVSGNSKDIMPMLFHGCTGEYCAAFSTNDGEQYDLGKVTIRNGWVQPPPPTTVEIMELRIRADEADEKIALLEGIFDTNALNFII